MTKLDAADDNVAPRRSRTRTARLPMSVSTAHQAVGALASLMRDLPKLREKAGMVDFAGSPEEIVHSILENAETTVGAMNMGIAAIGVLIAHSSPEIEDGTIHQPTIESLGWVLSEMGELAGTCTVLAARCRQAHPPTKADRAPAWVRVALDKTKAAVSPNEPPSQARR